MGLPIYPLPPTNWSSLYTSLKIVQGINISVTGNRKTFVTLNLKLCYKCLHLMQDREIYENCVFQLGELHAVFVMLKVISKYVESSGSHSLFLQSGT